MKRKKNQAHKKALRQGCSRYPQFMSAPLASYQFSYCCYGSEERL